ncbi:hypothetical protein ABH15_13075 [Methanoculleus taiwanensis]|uniref:Uncharacterized protein n=1 Tax=Methanoculleus taiwanensis TaxID=1550565 RepID=A0A498GWC3_9EURY|nr:hypothetical protein ABH15_13075 [Methanoculleus taiwanensis]
MERGRQQGTKEFVEAAIRDTPTYPGLREELHNFSFRAVEDLPGSARWESREYELVVLVRTDPETQAVTEARVFASGDPETEAFPR